MKTSTHTFLAAGYCAAVLATGISTSFAQAEKDGTASVPPPVAPATGLKRVTAPLLPTGPNSKAKGTVVFSMAGDALNVTGQIEGLEPNRSYQLVIERRMSEADSSAVEARTGPPGSDGPPAAPPPSSAGKPAAGPPVAGPPNEPPPAAGKPDGTSRPGAPGAGTSGTSVSGGKESRTAGDLTVPKLSGDMGIITADSAGVVSLNKTLRNVELGAGPNGILGNTVVVREVVSETSSTTAIVAKGVIILPSGEGPEAAK
jgi:hypothetical protein